MTAPTKVGAVVIFREGTQKQSVQNVLAGRVEKWAEESPPQYDHAEACAWAAGYEAALRNLAAGIESAEIESFNPEHGEPVFYVP